MGNASEAEAGPLGAQSVSQPNCQEDNLNACLIRTGSHCTVNKHTSSETKGSVGGSQKPSGEDKLHANPEHRPETTWLPLYTKERRRRQRECIQH